MASELIVETPDGRFYEIDGHQYISVTNIIDRLSNLEEWTAWEAAAAAIEMLPALLGAALVDACGRTWAGHRSHTGDAGCTALCPCGQCVSCLHHQAANAHRRISSRRAKEGGALHDYVERWVLSEGRVKISVPAEVQPYVVAFHAMCREYGLTPQSWLMVEAVAFNLVEEYAGTTDGAIRIYASASAKAAELVASVLKITISAAIKNNSCVDVLIDTKTKEKPLEPGKGAKLYPAHSLQLAAYFACPKIQIKGVNHFAQMPELHGAVLIQLRPPREGDPGFTVRPVDAGPRTLAAFLNQKAITQWLREHGTASVSVRTFKPMPEPRKRTPRKKINDAPTPEQAAATVARDTKLRKKTAAPLSLAGQPGLRDDEIPF